MTKNKKQDNKYKIINTIIGALFLATVGGLVYCAMNTKTPEDNRIIDMKEDFAEIAVAFHCGALDNLTVQNICTVENTDFTEDGDFYVRFEHTTYDRGTNQEIETNQYKLLFYPNEHRDDDSGLRYFVRVEKD